MNLNAQQEKAIELIRKQQEGASPHIAMMGEQLADICRREAHSAELIAADLTQPELSLAKLANRFQKYADSHKSGNTSVITPQAAEQLMREFYSLAEPQVDTPASTTCDYAEDHAAQTTPKCAPVLSFLDMLATVEHEQEV